MNEPAGFWVTAEHAPERVAVINPDGSSVTYADLEHTVNALSHGLRALGCGRGSTVALLSHNHELCVALSFATGQIGAYLLPLNWHSTAAEISYMLADSSADVFVVGAGIEASVTAGLNSAPDWQQFSLVPREGYRPLSHMTDGQPNTRPEGLIGGQTMVYTSGTTGRPKGVRRPITDIPPESLFTLSGKLWAKRDHHPGPGVTLLAPPMYHSASGLHGNEALYYGNTLVLMDEWDTEASLGVIQRHSVNTTYVAPIHLIRWLALDEAVRSSYNVSSLKLVMLAGAMCPVAIKRRAIEWLGPILFEYYGGTEGPFTSVTSQEWLEHPGTVGNVNDSLAEIKIFDDNGGELPAGQVGLLFSRVPGLNFEYHNDPEKTKGATRDGGWLTLGDLGYVDDNGWLFLADRRTDMINSGGVNIYPAEIEDRLLEHPAVAGAAVAGAPDDEWGQRVVAFVELVPTVSGNPALAEELSAFCREGLAGFKCPREIEFRDELPRVTLGKLKRQILRDELATRAAGRQQENFAPS